MWLDEEGFHAYTIVNIKEENWPSIAAGICILSHVRALARVDLRHLEIARHFLIAIDPDSSIKTVIEIGALRMSNAVISGLSAIVIFLLFGKRKNRENLSNTFNVQCACLSYIVVEKFLTFFFSSNHTISCDLPRAL